MGRGEDHCESDRLSRHRSSQGSADLGRSTLPAGALLRSHPHTLPLPDHNHPARLPRTCANPQPTILPNALGACGKAPVLVQNSWPRAEPAHGRRDGPHPRQAEVRNDACVGVVSRDARRRATGAGTGLGGTQARTPGPVVRAAELPGLGRWFRDRRDTDGRGDAPSPIPYHFVCPRHTTHSRTITSDA